MYQLFTKNNQRITGPMPKGEAEEKAAKLRDQGLDVEIVKYALVEQAVKELEAWGEIERVLRSSECYE